MKEKIMLLIKGFFIGVANIIPGVSGGTLAITLGIYEKLIEAISHFFKNFKENIAFLIPIAIGMGVAILTLSNVISFSLDKYPLVTILFFIGLILGGLPLLIKRTGKNFKKISNILILIITFTFVILLSTLKGEGKVDFTDINIGGYLALFLVGVVAAATMIIPGISGSFILMLLGYYKPIVDTISDLTKFNNLLENIMILVPFGIGVLVGIVVIAKIIEFLFKKYEKKTYFGIIGFVLASILTIFLQTEGLVFSIPQILLSIVLFILGFVVAYKLGD